MKKILFIFSVAIAMFGCTKENSNEFFPYASNELNDTNWYSIIPADAKVRELGNIFPAIIYDDSVHVMNGGTLSFVDSLGYGARIFFPPYFCQVPGTMVPDRVKVEVQILKSKGDMVKFNKPTMSYGSLLVTGGSMHIKVTHNSQELPLTQGMALDIRLITKMSNSSPSQNMEVFYGKENAYPNTVSQQFTWIPSTDSFNTAIPFTDSSTQMFGYLFNSSAFGWVNCDYFSDSTQPRTRAVVNLPPNFTNANTNVYAVLQSPDIVAQLSADVTAKVFSINNIYVGKVVTFVTISSINGDLYFGTHQATTSPNMNVNIVPEQKTKQQIEAFLNNL